MPYRLKSLELQGYKTFATRTLFEYGGAVTAIVGPNGSGKSNIADAIRWVLGEQSFSLLRGKKTEDMIFSGSESRPRASMASATMVFDNADQWLPIDFSEVAITRRAYRDGQNEYLINGQKVRLKDVTELIAGSGLAERTYTVIGQGLVDVALALKAEERRQLFEEAAGIGLYRGRREEALRRLDVTRRNLERVRDILSELSPRLQSLERQVKRYEEYEQIRKDLKALLLEWYGYHWHREQKELVLAKESVKKREQALKSAREKLSQQDDVISHIKGELIALRTELSQGQQEIEQLNQRHNIVLRQIAVLNERRLTLEQRQNSLEAEIVRTKEELVYAREMADEADKELALAKDEHAEMAEKARQAREELESAQEMYRTQEIELKQLRDQFEQEIRKKAEIEARLNEANTRATHLREAVREREQNLVQSQREQARLAEIVQGLQAERENRQKQHHQALQQVEKFIQEENKLSEEKNKKNNQINEMNGELVRLTTQLDVLNEADQNLTDYNQATRYILREEKNINRMGVLGVLGANLMVAAEYETAIASIMGELADTIVVAGEHQVEQLVDLLNQEKIRGILFGLENGKTHSPNHQSRLFSRIKDDFGEDVIGWVSDLLSGEGEFLEAAKRLFSNYLVVKNRQTAKQIRTAHSDSPTLVTLQGEIYYPNGVVISAGSIEAGKIRRPRYKKELSQKIEKLKAQLDKELNTLKSIENSLTDLQHKRASYQAQADGLRQEIENIDRRIREHLMALETVKNRIESINKTSAREQEEAARLIQQMEEDKQAREIIHNKVDGLEAQVRQQAEKLALMSFDSIKAQLTQWDIYMKASERTLQSAHSRVKERELQVNRLSENLVRLEAQMKETQQNAGEIATELVKLQAEQQEIETIKKQKLESQTPLEGKIAEKESRLEQLNQETRKIQQGLIQLEQQHAQARIGYTRQQERFEMLRRRIEEDFGLVDFDYAENVSGPTPLPLEGMVERLPIVQHLSSDLEEDIKRFRAQFRRMGPINPDAQLEYEQVKSRYEFLLEQIQDLETAEGDIKEIINELDATMRHDFQETFEAVAEEFKVIFGRLFTGGSARLILTDGDDLSKTGIEIEARLPGKRMQGLSLLSGGERSLTAVALIFALLKVSPTPFCVLDEVDAMLDEANVGRFREVLKELSSNTQFIIVTHNRNTVQVADVIYGVTMGRDSTSQVISLKLDELDKVIKDSDV